MSRLKRTHPLTPSLSRQKTTGQGGRTKCIGDGVSFHLLKVVLLIALLSLSTSLYAQIDSTEAQVQEDILEALNSLDPSDPNFNPERLTQLLQELAANPVNINEAGKGDLLPVPGIDLRIAKAIVTYRENGKPFESVGELLNVPGIGQATLARIRPYVAISSGLDLSKTLYSNINYWTHNGEFEMFTRYQRELQTEYGYRIPDSAGGYLGNPIKYYQRFKYESAHFSINLTQQKDAGETLTGMNGFNFNSWHVALKDNGLLNMLVVGDYSLNFGQGLILWPGRTFGKGRNVIGTGNRSGQGLDPYTSSQESNAFRGVAATMGNKLQITGFYSARKYSASKVGLDSTRMFQTDGYMQTRNDIEDQNNLKMRVWGGRAQLELPIGFLGVTGYRAIFDKYIYAGDRIADRFEFHGRITSAIGFDYRLLVGPTIVFGEIGRSKNDAYGFVTGVESPLGESTEITLVYRNYARDFQSILGNGFGEAGGEPHNEKGIYIGLKHMLTDKVTISAYFDQFQSPAPSFGTEQSSRGYDWFGLVEVHLSSDLQFYIQAENEIEDTAYEITDEFGRQVVRLGEEVRGGIRAQLQYGVNRKVRLRARAEMIRAKQPGEEVSYGYLIFQDIRFTPTEKLTIDARITVFDTESYDSRLYQFENGLLYVLSNQVLYGQGERLYAVVNYEPLQWLEIWTKFGITIFENRRHISSGLSQINGNVQSDVGLQIRVQI